MLVLIRVPVYLVGLPELIPELQWMLVGEQINKGFVMYSEIWDNTAPLSALVYAGLDGLFGRSQTVYQLAALVVAAFQVIYFNVMINNRDIFAKRNYVPGLIYLLFPQYFLRLLYAFTSFDGNDFRFDVVRNDGSSNQQITGNR